MKKAQTAPTVAPLTWRERIKALRNLPRFFRLVWQTSPRLMALDASLRIVKSAMPVSILYIGKLIIDQVVLLVREGSTSQDFLWKLVVLEFALALLSDGLSRIITLIDSLLGERFANLTSIRIMEHAAALDLDQFEDTTFYDKL